MTEIRLLEQATIDKIAAGEVVERPGSIVKELCENSIDAGAGAITVEIRDGGLSLIRVTDNGEGIESSQIENAFARHATSKIFQAQDLLSVDTLGFRGEALSSISAVSRVELITKTADALVGVRALLEGGRDPENRGTFPWGKEPGKKGAFPWGDEPALYKHFKALGELRNGSPALKKGSFRAFADGDGKLIIERSFGRETRRFAFSTADLSWEELR